MFGVNVLFWIRILMNTKSIILLMSLQEIALSQS
jgi:hypothetical protein